MLAEYTARNNAALVELVETHGVEVRRLPEDVIAVFKKLSLEVTEEIIDDDPLSIRIYESFKEYYQGVVDFHEISEKAYINAR